MPRIFICYRREDTECAAQQIYKKLAEHYGDEAEVFDVDSIPKGFDFAKYLEQQVRLCDVLLAVIGSQWLSVETDGKRRIADSNDWVYVEIQAALERGIPVIPVLVGSKTLMPTAAELPEGIRSLSGRNATEVRPG